MARGLLTGAVLLLQMEGVDAMPTLPALSWNPLTAVITVAVGTVSVIQVNKIQEAVGDGASAVIQEVATGTTRLFESVFDGLNNTVKVSMLMIGICILSILNQWIQTTAYRWWTTQRDQPTEETSAMQLTNVDDAVAPPAIAVADTTGGPRLALVDGVPPRPALSDQGENQEATVPLLLATRADVDMFGPRTGKISRLTLEQITRAIWFRDRDGVTIRREWCEEIESLMVPGVVKTAFADKGGEGRRQLPYEQYVFYIAAASPTSKKTFTVSMSKAIEDVSRTSDLNRTQLRSLISCTCSSYDTCKGHLPTDFSQEWPGAHKDVLCKHCVVILLRKLIAQTYPTKDGATALHLWKSDRKNWPLTPGSRGLGDESRDVYVTTDGLKVGPRQNFLSDYNRNPEGRVKTVYVAADPHEWIKSVNFPTELELQRDTTKGYEFRRHADSANRHRRRPWFEHILETITAIETGRRRSRAMRESGGMIEPFGEELTEEKELLRGAEGRTLRKAENGESRIDPLRIRGRFRTLSLRKYLSPDGSGEVAVGLECGATRAAVIARTQMIAEQEAVLLCCNTPDAATRSADMIATLLLLAEKGVPVAILIGQDIMKGDTPLTRFLIKAKDVDSITTMVTPEKFVTQVMCLGLRVRVITEALLEDAETVYQDRRTQDRWSVPTQMYKEGITLEGQPMTLEMMIATGTIFMSKGLPASAVEWFEGIMTYCLPLDGWLRATHDNRDVTIEREQRFSLSYSQTTSTRMH